MNNILNTRDFPYIYRFNDKNYNILPPDDLQKIIIVNIEDSSSLWGKYVDESSPHFKMIDVNKKKTEKIISDCGWGSKRNEDETRRILKSLTDENTEITLFWSKHYAIKTMWKIFCEYWSDFCYPSDDGNVILYKDKLIVYDEDILYKCEILKI